MRPWPSNIRSSREGPRSGRPPGADKLSGFSPSRVAIMTRLSTSASPSRDGKPEKPRETWGTTLAGEGMDFQQILHSMVQKKASDVHLKAGAPPLFRVDGDLIPQGETILSPQ